MEYLISDCTQYFFIVACKLQEAHLKYVILIPILLGYVPISSNFTMMHLKIDANYHTV